MTTQPSFDPSEHVEAEHQPTLVIMESMNNEAFYVDDPLDVEFLRLADKFQLKASKIAVEHAGDK